MGPAISDDHSSKVIPVLLDHMHAKDILLSLLDLLGSCLHGALESSSYRPAAADLDFLLKPLPLVPEISILAIASASGASLSISISIS